MGDSSNVPSGDYGQDYYDKVPGLATLPRYSSHWWAVRFYARIAERLLRRCGGRRVLEVGCAHGYMLARLEERLETFGIDLSTYALEQARKNAPNSTTLHADLLGELPEPVGDGGFDLIVAKYVLEHIDRPTEALERIHALLNPGGYLFYSVPNMKSPGIKMKGEQWFAFLDPTHVSLLQPEDWVNRTREAGFEIERQVSDGLWDIPYLQQVPYLIQYGLFTLPTVASVLLARPMLPVGWGENLIVIARKRRS